jgi:hypothetical protein
MKRSELDEHTTTEVFSVVYNSYWKISCLALRVSIVRLFTVSGFPFYCRLNPGFLLA